MSHTSRTVHASRLSARLIITLVGAALSLALCLPVQASTVLVCTSAAHEVKGRGGVPSVMAGIVSPSQSQSSKPPAAVKTPRNVADSSPAYGTPAWTLKVYGQLADSETFTCSNGQKTTLTALMMSGNFRLVSLTVRSAPSATGQTFSWYGLAILTLNSLG